MPNNDGRSDHDLLVGLSKDMEFVKTTISQIVSGETANCAKEESRIKNAEDQIEKLWKTRASAVNVNLLWGVFVAVMGGLIMWAATGH